MRTWTIAVLVACAAVGCSKRKLHWGDKRATAVTGNGFVVPIPAGWRDGAEATDDDLKSLLAKQPGAHGLVKEDFDGTVIVVKAGANPPTPAPACDEIAQTVAKSEGATATDVQKLTVDGDPACQWLYKAGDIDAHYWMRFHADKVLAVMCFTKTATDLATCEQTRAGAKPAP